LFTVSFSAANLPKDTEIQNQMRSMNERLFSAAGQIHSDRRSNLLSKNAKKLLFLSYNIRLFNYDYWTLTALLDRRLVWHHYYDCLSVVCVTECDIE